WPAVPLWCWGLASATCGLGMGLAYAPLSLVTLAQADPDRQGEATSSLQMTDMLGNALGAGIGGALVTLGATLGHADWVALAELFGVAALMAVIVAILAPRLAAPRRSLAG
ncbi:MAG: MFS transporter, partial [Acidimicrobiales bacterium]